MVRGVEKAPAEAGGPQGHRPAADGSPESGVPVDGRVARAVRTRAAIVDALLDLVHEGDLQPTANRIAERAGISLRLIYHHFGDLESLFRSASAREAERLGAQVTEIDLDLPRDERIDQFVRQRTQLLEWITPVRRASMLQEPFSEELRAARDALYALGEQQVLDVFAVELGALPAKQRLVAQAALANALSWGFWNDLRTNGRDFDEATEAVKLVVSSLLS